MTSSGATPPVVQGDTRDHIRVVALDLFADRGYDGASMRDIANAVGIQPASLYHHFASKEDILWDLTWTALEELEASRRLAMRERQHLSPRRRLALFVGAHVAFHARCSQQARLVNLNLSHLEPERFDQALVSRDAYEGHLRSIIEAGIDGGEMDVPDLRVTTYVVLQMCTAVSTWFRADGPLTIDQLCDVYEELVDRMVRA